MLDHPNIVKYIECIQTQAHINLILEYVEGGSLDHILKQNGKMGEHLVFIFVKQVLEGLVYLHDQGIIHRDIKGANLLLTKTGVVKLADFGHSILNDKNKANSIAGSPYWMAPEVIEQKGNISPKCDIWSLGSTIIQLLTTQPPNHEFNMTAAMFRIVTDDCPPLPNDISPHLRDFLLRCFVKDPEKRASARELLHHPWITTPNKKLVKKFIYENENGGIPINLINEWKNNYRENLSSITSSQNDNNNNNNNNLQTAPINNRSKSKSNSVADINSNLITTNINEENNDNERYGRKDTLSKTKRKDLSSPKQNYARHNKLIELGKLEPKKPLNKKSKPKDRSSKEKVLQYSNLSLKNLNNPKSPKTHYQHHQQLLTTQSNENIKTISCNDDNYIYKSNKSIIAESENEVNMDDFNPDLKTLDNIIKNTFINKQTSLVAEINTIRDAIYPLRENNITRITETTDTNSLSEFTLLNSTLSRNNVGISSSNKKSGFNSKECKQIANELTLFIYSSEMSNNSQNQNESSMYMNALLCNLCRLHTLLSTKPNLIFDFLSQFNLVKFCNLINSKYITPKSMQLILNLINLLLYVIILI